ncbi:CRISPR-associated helicase/endonuclease Cas3 [Bacillaceae bacterium SAS-127]|nr:CRISPR-associated helicase/endonuclease Cas3 [Bacillaceae bacterium SAS-127]
MDINELLSKGAPLYAHIGRGQAETLAEHSHLVMSFCDQLKEENGLKEAISRTICSLTYNAEPLLEEEYVLVEKWFNAAIHLHDLGKVNPAFQKVKMKQKQIKLDGEMTTHHSLLSSLLFLEHYEQDLQMAEDDDKLMFLAYILYVFSYIISRHHSYLEDFSMETYGDKLRILAEKIDKKPTYLTYYARQSNYFQKFQLDEFIEEGYLDSESHNHYPFYILTRLLYSTLVASDFYATYTYDKEGNRPKFRYLMKEDVHILRQTYRDTKVVQGIEAYKQDPDYFSETPINKLRSDMYLEAEKELIRHQNESIFYLEAPTGSGKTNISINLALTLLEEQKGLNKILYIFPFNTLVEQTKMTLDEIFPKEIQNLYPISVINSVTPIIQSYERSKEEEHVDVSETTGKAFYDYKEEVLYRQMLQYPITVTSHVNLFNYLFGVGRESNLAFAHLCNSVIIIDEIQSYKNARWMEMIEFFHQFAHLLNMKIIIMSATLPKLDRLLNEKQEIIELLPNARTYFTDPLFKNRVKIHFDLIDQGVISSKQLVDFVVECREKYGKKRFLIECINLKKAEEVYQLLHEIYGDETPVIRLTGSHHAYYRKKVIDQLGKNKDGSFKLEDVIVVATQVIEAGVDIDMDIGFKDIAILDSDEQFLGRINRSCLREECHVYFFNMSKASKIYRNDFRLQFNLLEDTYRQHLLEKNFDYFYEQVFAELREFKSEINENNILDFYKKIHQLQYGEVAAHMKLIDEQKYQVFLAYEMILDNGTVIDGQGVWNEYKQLIENRTMDFSERRVKLSIVNEKMSYFLFSIYQEPSIYDQKLGDIYFIENGEGFLQKDTFTGLLVFDERALEDHGKRFIL